MRARFKPQVEPMEIDPASEDRLGGLVGTSLAMRQIFALLKRIAPTDSTLLLVGETGSGKGAAAKAIHGMSPRSTGPFIVFDCAAVSDSLIESELFGHEKGALPAPPLGGSAIRFAAPTATLFLDEIGELPLDMQPKLLRALEERKLSRLGGSDSISFDTRVIAASKKDLWTEAQAARFREDLYFRLSVFTVHLPNLRDRKEDIPLLVDSFADEPLWKSLSESMREQFMSHTWPGNVRELRNAIERARHMADIPELNADTLLREFAPPSQIRGETLPVDYAGQFKESKDSLIRSFEKEYLTRLLSRVRNNVTKAAREAGLDRKHLYSLLHKYGLVSPAEPSE